MGQVLDGQSNRRHIEKGHAFGRIDQQIEVAVLRVIVVKNGTENARIQPPARPVAARDDRA